MLPSATQTGIIAAGTWAKEEKKQVHFVLSTPVWIQYINTTEAYTQAAIRRPGQFYSIFDTK